MFKKVHMRVCVCTCVHVPVWVCVQVCAHACGGGARACVGVCMCA